MHTDSYYNCEFFELIKNHCLVFSALAVLFSLFWGVHGISYAIKEDKKEWRGVHEMVIIVGYFLSESIGSFFGWICLYVLSVHMSESPSSIGMSEVFLVLGAFIGISGWSYQVFDLIKRVGSNDKSGASG